MLLRVIYLYLGLALAETCESGECEPWANFLQVALEAKVAEHPWPHARGKTTQRSGFTPEIWSTHHLAWNWTHPEGQYHLMFAGGPVIDSENNIYQMTCKGLLAFSQSGKLLWSSSNYTGLSNNEVALFGDLVLGTTVEGRAFAVDRHSGKLQWETKLAEDAGGDVGYPGASENVLVVGTGKGHISFNGDGNRLIMGLDAPTGEKLWEYALDDPVWNFAPLFPKDGTVAFMDHTGTLYRLDLKSGKELWRRPVQDSADSFGDGGAALGPGTVYSCSNPGASRGQKHEAGMVRAFKLEDGSKLWERVLSEPCNTFPAVGHVRGSDALAVVVTPGGFFGQEELTGSILALDAATGDTIWEYQAKPWSGVHGFGAGDVEGLATRLHDRIQFMCLSAHWSAPMIDGDGSVLVGRMDGKLYQVLGPEREFVDAENTEVSTGVAARLIDLQSSSLHGALSAAPGMFAVSTCDTLRVFKA
mmetsp:Transcript_120260/g.285741  ORF Transcript_120260/g.285741 Transcript_120260/m.285741 type:complete len:473 (-) Transcript_120260:42-1460(-)